MRWYAGVCVIAAIAGWYIGNLWICGFFVVAAFVIALAGGPKGRR
jgi:hypothetical protein